MAIDFSSYYDSHRYSDLELVVYEETGAASAGTKRKATVEERLPGHAMLLCSVSPYFKAKVENWPDQDAAPSTSRSAHQPDQHSKQTVELPVPPGQLAVGQLLVKSMCHAQLDLAGVPQTQLMQLLILADRYEVAKSLAAAAAALEAIPTQAFEWETAAAVYALPAGCADNPACQPLFSAAAAKVCAELGDLEAVWVQGGVKQQVRLLSLPFAGLLQLLESSATRVRSENTVAHTVARWYEWRQATPAEQQPTREQVRQLVGAVRMQHCSRLYVSTCFASEAVAAAALEPQELAEACGMAGVASLAAASPLAGCQWPVLDKFPAWGSDKRPASAVGSVVLDWSISKQQLEQAVQKVLDSADTHATLSSSLRVVMGFPLYLWVKVFPEDGGITAAGDAPGRRLKLGVFVHVAASAPSAVCIMEHAICARQPTAAGGRFVQVAGGTNMFPGKGWGTSFPLGAVMQPADALLRCSSTSATCWLTTAACTCAWRWQPCTDASFGAGLALEGSGCAYGRCVTSVALDPQA